MVVSIIADLENSLTPQLLDRFIRNQARVALSRTIAIDLTKQIYCNGGSITVQSMVMDDRWLSWLKCIVVFRCG